MSELGKSQAFPRTGSSETIGERDGMTLRQWYMGQVAPALIKVVYAAMEPKAGEEASKVLKELPALVSPLARTMADALIAASVQ